MADLLNRRCTIGRLALRLAEAEALPYWSIVVETCACRMSFCCTPTGAPVSSSHARYLARKGGQRRSQGLLLLDLGSKLVFLLCHGFEKKHQPILPVLLFLTDRLLGATQCEVVVVLVRLDDSFNGAVRNVSVPRTQQQKCRHDAGEPADFASTEEAFCCPDFRVTTRALCLDLPASIRRLPN
jgi:hypothetical protein